MVGLGTQDTFEEAVEFRDMFEITAVRMLWDPGFDSWIALGIRGQPQAMLFDARGEVLGQWVGFIDEEEVLELAAG